MNYCVILREIKNSDIILYMAEENKGSDINESELGCYLFGYCQINNVYIKRETIGTTDINYLIFKKENKKFYNKTYDPTNFIYLLREKVTTLSRIFAEDSTNDYKKLEYLGYADLLRDVEKNMNLEIAYNCCNCVSISIYIGFGNFTKERIISLGRYLPNVVVTLRNIKLYLDDWLCRIYLDKTIFTYIEYLCNSTDEEYLRLGFYFKKILDFIINHSHSEIYVMLTQNVSSNYSRDLGNLRSHRFIGCFEENVNINAPREADGIVNSVDCFNLRQLEKIDDVLIFINGFSGLTIKNLADIGNNLYTTINKPRPYSQWLNKYIEVNAHYNHHMSSFNITAGTIATKIKFKKEYYYYCADYVSSILRENTQFSNLRHGYDEILLMKLYDFLDFEYKNEPASDKYIIINLKKSMYYVAYVGSSSEIYDIVLPERFIHINLTDYIHRGKLDEEYMGTDIAKYNADVRKIPEIYEYETVFRPHLLFGEDLHSKILLFDKYMDIKFNEFLSKYPPNALFTSYPDLINSGGDAIGIISLKKNVEITSIPERTISYEGVIKVFNFYDIIIDESVSITGGFINKLSTYNKKINMHKQKIEKYKAKLNIIMH